MIESIQACLRETDEKVCDELVTTTHGVAMVTPTLPLVWHLNAIHVDDPEATAGALMDEAELLQGDCAHRKLVVRDEALGARLAPELAAAGWNVFRLLVMVHAREPAGAPHVAEGAELSREVGAAALAAFRREQPFGWQEEAIRQLAAMDERFGAVCAAGDFGSPPEDPACACRLYLFDRLAQVDEVGTVQARRGRGHAKAVVLAAVRAASARERAPTFLLTDAADWPRKLYGGLGFEGIASVYEFLKLPLGMPRP